MDARCETCLRDKRPILTGWARCDGCGAEGFVRYNDHAPFGQDAATNVRENGACPDACGGKLELVKEAAAA